MTRMRISSSKSNSLRLSDRYTGQDVAFNGSSDILDGFSNAPIKVSVNNHYKNKKNIDVNYFSCSRELGLASKYVPHVCLDDCGATYYANTEYLETLCVDFSSYSNRPNHMGSSWAELWACSFKSQILTGVLAIIDIMRHRPRSLYISGIDLYTTVEDERSFIPNYSRCGTYNLIPHLLFLRQLADRGDVHFANYDFLKLPIKRIVPNEEDQYIDVESPSILKQYSFPAIHRSA